VPFAEAWALVAENAAAAVRLADRGVLRDGLRGDVVVVDARNDMRPRVVATIAAGRLVHLSDGALLSAA
jgi:alpha-D-ribose 1-methylphosphonate 5-triphosphate diphosphatase